jgi:hypothetical protein
VQSVRAQKIELFKTTAVRISNPDSENISLQFLKCQFGLAKLYHATRFFGGRGLYRERRRAAYSGRWGNYWVSDNFNF